MKKLSFILLLVFSISFTYAQDISYEQLENCLIMEKSLEKQIAICQSAACWIYIIQKTPGILRQ